MGRTMPGKEENRMGWKFNNDRSIYLQLVEQIQNRIATGFYKPGGRLPSVRELAGEAEVNPNTMQKALAELERQELLYSQRTAGRFVTENEGRISRMKKQAAKGAVDVFLKQMENLGLSEAEIIELIREAREEKKDEQDDGM